MGRGRRMAPRLRFGLFLACSLLACQEPPSVPSGKLSFELSGGQRRTFSLGEISKHSTPRVVGIRDPYYHAAKRFLAMPIAPLLAFAYGQPVHTLRDKTFQLTASDGYSVAVAGERLLDDHALVAVDDVDVPGFAPIGPQQVNPGPAYLIWEHAERRNLTSHPQPWQLVAINMVGAAELYPHAIPKGEAKDSAAMHGYQIFRGHCIRCHAINREGGHVGPDLNVPQSIVAYRPVDQIRAYIRNPLTFRYGVMPPNPDLTDRDLDALIAYFRAMSTRQYEAEGSAP